MPASSFSVEFALVDDNLPLAEAIASSLRERGHSCTPMTGGLGEWLEHHRCEVLVVDLSMPEIDTVALITETRQRYANLPIILFNALGSATEQINAALRAGANGYVSKSLPPEQLDGVLSRVLSASRKHARRPERALIGAA